MRTMSVGTKHGFQKHPRIALKIAEILISVGELVSISGDNDKDERNVHINTLSVWGRHKFCALTKILAHILPLFRSCVVLPVGNLVSSADGEVGVLITDLGVHVVRQ